MRSSQRSPGEIADLYRQFQSVLTNGSLVYQVCIIIFFAKAGFTISQGYVEDARNTDNAWLESTATNYHDTNGIFKEVDLQPLEPGLRFVWIPITQDLNLRRSQQLMVMQVRIFLFFLPRENHSCLKTAKKLGAFYIAKVCIHSVLHF